MIIAPKRELNVYFGTDSICLTETHGHRVIHHAETAHSFFGDAELLSVANPETDIKLSAIIQKFLYEKGIKATCVNLSLPSREIILRSFFIPWMTSAEVKGVVEFEARRYIPFRLDELIYVYHATTIFEKKVKRIHILFVAVRKDLFERYRLILEQAGLRIAFAEPSIASITRLLLFKKAIHPKQRVVIIQADQKEGLIIIVNQGVPQFMRDFSLLETTAKNFQNETAFLTNRITNEIRISLDYYRRLHTFDTIDKILLTHSHAVPIAAETLEAEFKIPTTALPLRSLINSEEEVELGALSAYGAGLHAAYTYRFKSDFSKAVNTIEKPASSHHLSLPQGQPNYATCIKLAVFCILSLYLFSSLTKGRNDAKQAALRELTGRAGVYESSKTADIERKYADVKSRLNTYKRIVLKSNVSFFLRKIPKYLPNEVWLASFNMTYKDNLSVSRAPESVSAKSGVSTGSAAAPLTEITVDLAGYAYDSDKNREIAHVNAFLANLKSDAELKNSFSTITLSGVKKQAVDENTATSFQISCK